MDEAECYRDYLEPTDYCDSYSDEVARLASSLARKSISAEDTASRAFYWVRENIRYRLGDWGYTASKTLEMISFKYEERISHEDLMRVAKQRVDEGHLAVVANRGEESSAREHVAHLVCQGTAYRPIAGKEQIAAMLADFIEADLKATSLA